ncbi:MAG: hypothetical protein AAGA03_11370 [Planctomycetota bacterium]
MRRAKGGTVYLAVLAIAMVVTMIGLTASHLGRLQARVTRSNNNQTYARLLAMSGVEFGRARIRLDPFWRNNYQHDVETEISVGNSGEKISFKFLDPEDGDLSDNENDVAQIAGIGRFGDATFIYRVDYAPANVSEATVGPEVLKSQEELGTQTVDVDDITTVGQYFIPELPPEAVSWSLTSFDVYAEDHGPDNGILLVQLSYANDQNLPGDVIDTVSIDESLLPGSAEWYSITFANASSLDPTAGYCVAFAPGNSEKTMKAKVVMSATQTDTNLLMGDFTGWSSTPADSMQFRLRGTYTTSEATGDFEIAAGSWRRVEAN